MKKIVVILGHPDQESLCYGLAKSYEKGAKENGAEVRFLGLSNLTFNPTLQKGYKEQQTLEPDLEKAKDDITWADHLVFVYPVWWASIPALLKGFIDRVFTPGFAFKYLPKKVFQEKLLKGRTARLIVTMDTPKWYYRWFMKRSSQVMMKKGVLEFCGVKPVTVSEFSPVKGSSKAKKQNWLNQVYTLGKTLA